MIKDGVTAALLSLANNWAWKHKNMLIPTRTRLFVPRLGDGVVVADADPVGGVPARPERSKLESERHVFKSLCNV